MRLLFRVKRTRATVGETCVLVPVSLLNSCVTLDKSHTLYILHFLLYKEGIMILTYLSPIVMWHITLMQW